MKLNMIIFGFLLFLSSCYTFTLKPLDVHSVNIGNLDVRWFYTSSITTIHNHVEIKTKKGWEQVMESDGNGTGIYNVLINGDTVIVQACKDMLVYQLESIYWGTYVRLDTSISLYEYKKKFDPENAKYYTTEPGNKVVPH